MKSTRTFLAVLLAAGLLAACGENGEPGNGGRCVTDADCDDGDYCTIGRCSAEGVCQYQPRFDDGNPCTTNECAFVPGLDIDPPYVPKHTCNARGPDDPCCDDPACEDRPICTGQMYEFFVGQALDGDPPVQGLTQEPLACFLPPLVPAAISGLIKDTQYNAKLPLPESEFTEWETLLPVPYIGPISVTVRKNGGELLFDPVPIEPFDLVTLLPAEIIDLLAEITGRELNCLLGGTARGVTEGFGKDEFKFTLTVSNLTKAVGSGEGGCTLDEPAPSCVLKVVSKGNPLRRNP